MLSSVTWTLSATFVSQCILFLCKSNNLSRKTLTLTVERDRGTKSWYFAASVTHISAEQQVLSTIDLVPTKRDDTLWLAVRQCATVCHLLCITIAFHWTNSGSSWELIFSNDDEHHLVPLLCVCNTGTIYKSHHLLTYLQYLQPPPALWLTTVSLTHRLHLHVNLNR